MAAGSRRRGGDVGTGAIGDDTARRAAVGVGRAGAAVGLDAEGTRARDDSGGALHSPATEGELGGAPGSVLT